MAISFPITGVSDTFSSTRSPSFTLGTSPIEDDIIVAYVSANNAAATTDVADWTNVLGANTAVSLVDSSCCAVMVYHRVTAGEDAADTVTWTLTNLWDATETGRISVGVLRGVATSGELVGTSYSFNTNATTDGTIWSVTPSQDSTVIAGFNQDGTGGRTSTPTGYTEIAGGDSTQHNYIYRRTIDAVADAPTVNAAANTAVDDEWICIVACFAETGAAEVTYGTASGAISVVGSANGAITSRLFVGADMVDAVYVGADLVARVYYGDSRAF